MKRKKSPRTTLRGIQSARTRSRRPIMGVPGPRAMRRCLSDRRTARHCRPSPVQRNNDVRPRWREVSGRTGRARRRRCLRECDERPFVPTIMIECIDESMRRKPAGPRDEHRHATCANIRALLTPGNGEGAHAGKLEARGKLDLLHAPSLAPARRSLRLGGRGLRGAGRAGIRVRGAR